MIQRHQLEKAPDPYLSRFQSEDQSMQYSLCCFWYSPPDCVALPSGTPRIPYTSSTYRAALSKISGLKREAVARHGNNEHETP